ncbi:hypothetical protein [Echinimonas agarilytica]|uniref:Periplasmic protein n=1 Tax=Echinimonas agarilytica TaxID=1215918 RepID=A0AA42B7P5_9GAMM|nr:hypothetical protein [Echinimonas agarilytica]MCM2680410.1 hypothetical protein [Echinimonas agarilytica]
MKYSLILVGVFLSLSTHAGVMTSECDMSKAMKSAAGKQAIGVGGRCNLKQAVSDETSDVLEIEDKKHNKQEKDERELAKELMGKRDD